MPYRDSNTVLSDDQYKKLKANNPSLAAKYTYYSDDPAPKPNSSGSSTSTNTAPKTTSGGNVTLPVTGSGNIQGGSITLTPEQQAKVAKNNPTLASSLGLPPLSSVKEETRTLPTTSSVTTTPSLPDKPKSNLVEFADMLTRATDLARKRRLETQMGTLGQYGFTPGQVTPQTMAGIVSLLDRRASDFAGGVTGAAETAYRDQFSANQAEYELAVKKQEDEKNGIRELALSAVNQGLSKEVVNGILAAPTLDSAIQMAAGALQSKTEKEIRQVGGTIVAVDPKTGATEVVYEGTAATDKLLSPTEAARLGVPYGTTQAQAAGMNIVPAKSMGAGGGATGTGGGKSNTLTLTEADKLGLPRTLVGKSEAEVLQELQQPEPPQWFIDAKGLSYPPPPAANALPTIAKVVNGARQNTKAAWDAFRQGVLGGKASSGDGGIDAMINKYL